MNVEEFCPTETREMILWTCIGCGGMWERDENPDRVCTCGVRGWTRKKVGFAKRVSL